MKTFIDTDGFAALYNKNDHGHLAAKQVWSRLMSARARLYTSNFVISETITLLRARAGFSTSVRFGTSIATTQLMNVVRVTEDQENHAWSLFVKYADHDFSFVDCTSFAIIAELSIDTAIAFDKHFRIMGTDTLGLL